MGTVSEIPDLKFPDDRFRRPRNFAAVPMFPTSKKRVNSCARSLLFQPFATSIARQPPPSTVDFESELFKQLREASVGSFCRTIYNATVPEGLGYAIC